MNIDNFINGLIGMDYSGGVVFLNEQHTILPNQKKVLEDRFGDNYEILIVPKEGWTIEEMKELVYRLSSVINGDEVLHGVEWVFISPIPYLIKALTEIVTFAVDNFSGTSFGNMTFPAPCVLVFHNDKRNKKELPDGKVISVTAQDGWILV